MQKKIIALAVAGLVSGAAFAQTNVTIYGAADVTFDNVKATGDSTTATPAQNGNLSSRNRVSSNSSFLGFRGTEDLGNGLKAVFQFEGGVGHDSGGGYSFNRDSFVGLAGGFGTVAAGTLTGPTRALGAAMEPFAGSTGITANIGLIGKMGGDTGTATAISLFDTRWNNAIAYTSPSFGGLTATAAYVANENKTRDGADDTAAELDTSGYDIGLRYAVGPIMAGLTHNQVKIGDINNSKLTDTRAALRYNFGAGTVGLLFDRVKAKDNTGSETRNAWFIPVTFNVTPAGKIVAQYGKASDISGAGNGNTGAKMFALGYEHSLSKRTVVKAVWSQINNESDARYDFGINNVGPAAGLAGGADPKGFQVGVRHTF